MQYQDTLLMVFTGILAVAVAVQTILFIGMYVSIRKLTVLMNDVSKDLLRHVETVSAKVDESLASIKGITQGFKPIQENLTVTATTIHNRVVDIDAFLAEATSIARREIVRIQDTVQAASSRAQETMELLHESILTPINELNALTRAIRVGIDFLFRRRKVPSNSSAQDEEMFI